MLFTSKNQKEQYASERFLLSIGWHRKRPKTDGLVFYSCEVLKPIWFYWVAVNEKTKHGGGNYKIQN